MFLLRGRARAGAGGGGGGGRVGVSGEVSACKELERTSNSVFTCTPKQPSVLFCYCYMALIHNSRVSFWFRRYGKKKREKRKL